MWNFTTFFFFLFFLYHYFLLSFFFFKKKKRNITYHVGSRNEYTSCTGATHLLEHLMFKGICSLFVCSYLFLVENELVFLFVFWFFIHQFKIFPQKVPPSSIRISALPFLEFCNVLEQLSMLQHVKNVVCVCVGVYVCVCLWINFWVI